MSIFDIFKPQTPAPAAVDPNAQKPQGQQQQVPQGESQSLEMAGVQGKQTEQKPTPVDAYADLWQPPKTEPQGGDPGNQGVQKNPQTPQKQDYGKVALGLNFARNIKPELLQKASSGDAQAFSDVIDQIGRMATAAAFKFTDNHSSQAGTKLREEIEGGMPGKFREFSLSNQSIKNPILSKPGVKPVVEGIRLQLAAKFPEASTADLQEKAEQYFLDLTTELGGQQKEKEVKENPPGKLSPGMGKDGITDWDEYFGLKTSP